MQIRGGLKKFRPHREELERMGLDYERREMGDWEKVKTALLRYKTLHGHVDVERTFIVPATREWPELTHGMKLGFCVENIQKFNNYRKHRTVLEAMGIKYPAPKDDDDDGEEEGEEQEQEEEEEEVEVEEDTRGRGKGKGKSKGKGKGKGKATDEEAVVV